MGHHLRFRQIHLDFHTSGQIPGIGEAFDKKEWQQTLKDAHVNSITIFAKCHHGWHYNTTAVGHMHPQLKFDLLRAQFDACKEIDVNAPIYISAGFDDAMMAEHPDWVCQPIDLNTMKVGNQSNLEPGFHKTCFNSPYVDHLVKEIQEVVRQYPNCDGIFLDIINQSPCACEHCMKVLREHGWDPHNPEDLKKVAQIGLERYYRMTTAAVRDIDPNMPVFHNSGHVTPGKRDILNKYFSHLELESLPTGGWGYDHFALSAKYAKTLPFDFLGMTGKFHTSWGEFGGYKHPNALRYECASMLAFGAKSSIGDQLHPCGKLDPSTYRVIGRAYAEVEEKEPWCDNVKNVAEIAILNKAAVEGNSSWELHGDIGAGRVLLEGHFLFDIIDQESDFSQYKLLVMPDDILIGPALQARLKEYMAQGGRLLLSGRTGLDAAGKPLFDFGAEFEGESPYKVDYMLPIPELQGTDVDSPMVMYFPSQRVKATKAKVLGDIYDPYFNRTDHDHFCSHQHTPYRPEATGYAAGIQYGNITYLAHPVFTIYKGWGCVPMAQYLRKVVLLALGGESRLACNLPSMGRITVMDQPAENRSVVHLLYANVVPRGGDKTVNGLVLWGNGIVIEELMPLHGTKVSFKPDRPVKSITLEPQGTTLPFATEADGTISFQVEEFACHQMVVLHY
ncbi:MAG: beta-galactosidase trimerization domain-containing protein [Lentisphaeria bacterium]|nr:beta-galactosidase trimerization domain-containing protein [Lentisphaeria bacterium]